MYKKRYPIICLRNCDGLLGAFFYLEIGLIVKLVLLNSLMELN